MLALAERQILTQGLEWAFCDTDSMAISNIGGLPKDEFQQRALAVVNWFKDLNPYGESKPILQLEKVNFPPGHDGQLDLLDPPNCLAISAKRYVLFNRRGSEHVVRKASGHGLGHLLPPYDEPAEERQKRMEQIGVPLWQEDLWKNIIRAAEGDAPDQVDYGSLRNFDQPAGSRYAATTPDLLKWFDGYNSRHADAPIKPFGFLLSLFAKSKMQLAAEDQDALNDMLWFRRDPRPASPFFRNTLEAKHHAFDRELDQRIPASWLESYARNLVRYHLHPEMKFQGGDFDQRGILKRRHTNVVGVQLIGKESDHIEEAEFIGENIGSIEHEIDRHTNSKLREFVATVQSKNTISDRDLCGLAGVSHHTLKKALEGKPIQASSWKSILRAAEQFRHDNLEQRQSRILAMEALRKLHKDLGVTELARRLRFQPNYVGRVLSGSRELSDKFLERLRTSTDSQQRGR